MLLNDSPLHPVSTVFCMNRASAASRYRWACSPRLSGAASQTARAHATSPAHRSFLPARRRPGAFIRRTLHWRQS